MTRSITTAAAAHTHKNHVTIIKEEQVDFNSLFFLNTYFYCTRTQFPVLSYIFFVFLFFVFFYEPFSGDFILPIWEVNEKNAMPVTIFFCFFFIIFFFSKMRRFPPFTSP
jgi:hypothetical protein